MNRTSRRETVLPGEADLPVVDTMSRTGRRETDLPVNCTIICREADRPVVGTMNRTSRRQTDLPGDADLPVIAAIITRPISPARLISQSPT
jgi:hypothetical protein